MKENIRKNFFCRIKKTLKSKLNSGNVVTVMNLRDVSVIRYSAGLIKWIKDKLRTIDRKTRKTMTMHRALHPQVDVDRLYIPRNNGGRGMISVGDCVEMERESLKKCVEDSNERLLKTLKGEGILGDGMTKKEILKKRGKNFIKKPFHSQFMKEIDEVRSQETLNWLKTRLLKKETEGMLMAAQDQALIINSIKSKVDRVPDPFIYFAEK